VYFLDLGGIVSVGLDRQLPSCDLLLCCGCCGARLLDLGLGRLDLLAQLFRGLFDLDGRRLVGLQLGNLRGQLLLQDGEFLLLDAATAATATA
jgi:hypothetical protein